MSTRYLLVFAALLATSLALLQPTAPVESVTLHEACGKRDGRFADEVVRVPWTTVGVTDGIEIRHCVLRGATDTELTFLRDAEHLLFTARSGTAKERWVNLHFRVRTSTGREVTLGPARVRLAPFGQPSCRFDICELFTEPGERITNVASEIVRHRHPKHATRSATTHPTKPEGG